MNTEITVDPAVRVLVVDDSAFMRIALSRMIASEAGLEVAATASCGADALEKIGTLDPDVVTLDVNMPGLDGLGTLRHIMHEFPRPVIMVSSATEVDAETTLDALGSGAFDYVPKHLSPTSLDILHIRQDLISKIWAAAHSRRRNCAGRAMLDSDGATIPENHVVPAITPAIVALGTSTGGPNALQEILPRLPRELPVPVLIVQHMPRGFTAPLARRLDGICQITVHEAVDREKIRAGTAYIAPAGMHMSVERVSDSRTIICLDERPEASLHIPSVDVLMQSVAEAFKNRALGVIMTGMGCDGAAGMSAIYREGGLTIGQDEASCAVYGMPRACADLGILNRVVPLSQIPVQIAKATRCQFY